MEATELIPWAQVKEMSEVVAKSGLFGVKTNEQALALMMIAQAEGSHPMVAARDYHIIDGKPTLKADAKLGRFIHDGGKVEWIDYDEKKVSGKFTHPLTGSIVVTWTIEMAQRAGLINKDNWKKYPRAMLRARVIGEGVTTMAPWVAAGIITKEDAEDIEPQPRIQPPDPIETPVEVVETTTGEPRQRRNRKQADAAPTPEPEPKPEPPTAPQPVMEPPKNAVNLFD
jgi:hypothetical protein